MGERLKVFVSYTRADQAFVDRLRDDVEAKSASAITFVTAMPAIPAGSAWMPALTELIAACDAMILVLPSQPSSEFIAFETAAALARTEKHADFRIIPLATGGSPEVPLLLRNRIVLNASHFLSWDEFVDALCRALLTPPPATEQDNQVREVFASQLKSMALQRADYRERRMAKIHTLALSLTTGIAASSATTAFSLSFSLEAVVKRFGGNVALAEHDLWPLKAIAVAFVFLAAASVAVLVRKTDQ